MDIIQIVFILFNIICFLPFLFQVNKVIEMFTEGNLVKAIPESIFLPILFGTLIEIVNKLFFSHNVFYFWPYEILIAIIIVRIYLSKSDYDESIKTDNKLVDIITIISSFIIVLIYSFGKLIGKGVVIFVLYLFNKFQNFILSFFEITP